ncbi:hypothetical protein [Streptomyces sp. NPDC005262]|uniref:hypothetical protein n=1 Tax=Streptomyces sp. NPDC005262 TaxID=3364710 RepID=UPI003683A6E5
MTRPRGDCRMIVLNEVAVHDPWGFGWEALVAIGTLVLAMFTWRLAARTRQLAQETGVGRRTYAAA